MSKNPTSDEKWERDALKIREQVERYKDIDMGKIAIKGAKQAIAIAKARIKKQKRST